ncbi:MAG TPA: hypothetical protein VN081_03170 [Dongiaceae bacterium]|nr:hypothetical protein [Dongiaceae bacterium]
MKKFSLADLAASSTITFTLITCLLIVITSLVYPSMTHAQTAPNQGIASTNSINTTNAQVPPACKKFTSDWSENCFSYGPGVVTLEQKKTRLLDCLTYATEVSAQLAKMYDANGGMTSEDALNIARINSALLRMCVYKGRDKFASDDEINHLYDSFNRNLSK